MNFRITTFILATAAAACAHAPPDVAGVPQPIATGSVPAPAPAPRATADATRDTILSPAVPGVLSLNTVVELALRNNPATRIAWNEARAAADRYGVSRGALYPTVGAGATVGRSQSTTSSNGLERTVYGPTVSLSYLVFDFGGRRGAIESARETAVAAGFSQAAAVQATILEAESNAFSYLGTRALRDAQRATTDEAAAILAAAEERHRVGLATIADVLQARTVRAQEALNLESLEGALSVARGTLAVVMGFPATAPIELQDMIAADSATVTMTTQSVDSIIAYSVRNNPALGVSRAEALRAAADLNATRSSGWPSLTFGGNGGYVGSNRSTVQGRNYTLNFGLSIPLFNGFASTYAVHAAKEDVSAANARLLQTQRQVELQAFTSYYALQTATKRVRSAADVLANADASEQVARGRYTEGVGSIVDLLIAESALANARAQSLSAGWQWRTTLAQLAHDAGALGAHGETLIPLSGSSR